MSKLTRIAIVAALCWPVLAVPALAQRDADKEDQRLQELQATYDRECVSPPQDHPMRGNPLFPMLMSSVCPVMAGDLHSRQMRVHRAAWEGRDPFTCETTSIDAWLASVVALQRDARSAADQARRNPLGVAPQDFFETALNDIFRVAGIAMERQCIDIADRLYRMVLENFTTANFAAARDRARVGIDDVRERRRR